VLAEKEAEEEELAEDNWPVTSDEAKRSARKRGGAKTGKRHNRTRTARKARQGQARASGRPAEAAIRATRANAAPRRAIHDIHGCLSHTAHRTPHTTILHTIYPYSVYCDPPHPKPVKPVKSSIVEMGVLTRKAPVSLSQ
jgi:hypothetical protein